MKNNVYTSKYVSKEKENRKIEKKEILKRTGNGK